MGWRLDHRNNGYMSLRRPYDLPRGPRHQQSTATMPTERARSPTVVRMNAVMVRANPGEVAKQGTVAEQVRPELSSVPTLAMLNLLYMPPGALGSRQTKFAASFVSPVPLYTAVFGNGHRGRNRSTTPLLPLVECVATIRSGATPRSTHSSSAVCMSNEFGPGPPSQ